ncbi:hypothetical protein K439DRAFT_1334318 [Ramaria rubella]|nr:hypothetical protein K439DRAFT_1334318 [Ramaria rubella]
MAPSTSSFLDLKAQLAKQEAEFAQNRALGKDMVLKGGVQRSGKKPTIWAQPNKGVAARNARDLEWSLASKPTLEAAKDALERKALQYEKLKKGKTAGLSEKQYDSLLVDFDRKAEEEDYESDSSEDVDESLTVPKRLDDDDPIVEYEDEFGRMRTARQSEVPRNLQPPQDQEVEPEDDPYLIHGNVNYFPTYEPSAEKIAAVEAAAQEDANPATHYDATGEVRPRGAGFYQFSKDEETRQKQMEDLKRSRTETEKVREETGAAAGKEVRPGLEKRKREIEERRKAIEAKRRKVKDTSNMPDGEPVMQTAGKSVTASTSESSNGKRAKKSNTQAHAQSADEFLAALERDIIEARAQGV